jgi:hypothetical protein
MANEHLPTKDSGEPVVYQLRVKGHLGAQWGAWFGGMTVTQTANGETLITGLVADQAALYGLLRKVRDVGLPLISVTRAQTDQIDEPDSKQAIEASTGERKQDGATKKPNSMRTIRNIGWVAGLL